MVAYAYSTTLCAEMKCYVLMAVLILGVIGYTIVEIRHTKQVIFITFRFLGRLIQISSYVTFRNEE